MRGFAKQSLFLCIPNSPPWRGRGGLFRRTHIGSPMCLPYIRNRNFPIRNGCFVLGAGIQVRHYLGGHTGLPLRALLPHYLGGHTGSSLRAVLLYYLGVPQATQGSGYTLQVLAEAAGFPLLSLTRKDKRLVEYRLNYVVSILSI